MDVTLIAVTTVVGLVTGGALDPLGQRLAERTRLSGAPKRAEKAPGRDDRSAEPPAPGHVPVRSAEVEPRHLVTQGRSPYRTTVAAVVTGALFGFSAGHFGADLVLAPFCVFFALLVVVALTDLSHRLVPRRLIYPGLALILPLLVASAAVDRQLGRLSGMVIAGAVAFGIFFAIWWFVPQGMGFGDVRLAGVIGIVTGYLSLLHAYLAFLGGFVIGMVFGLVMMVLLSSGRKTRIPFAPALAGGAVLTVFFGAHVAHSLFPDGP
ncbi:MAG: prepilin peptidase [Acidimicrobiales bacterium]